MRETRWGARHRLVAALLTLLAALAVWWGVSRTARLAEQVPRPEASPPGGEIAYSDWDDGALALARRQSRLILLLVLDSESAAAARLQAEIGAVPALRRRLGSGLLAVKVDRRLRPDLADRYAEDRAPLAALLLPSGEALTVLEGAPASWPERIVEVDLYWREHPEKLADRVDEFWQAQAEVSVTARSPRPPAEADLETIDRALQGFVASLSGSEPGIGLWRADVAAYLSARGERESWARQALGRVLQARAARHRMVLDSLSEFLTPAGVMQTALDALRFGAPGDAGAADRARATLQWLEGRPPDRTAAEHALQLRLERALGGTPESSPAGSWLDPADRSGLALPHHPSCPTCLDGYLTDALHWLEYFLDSEAPADPSRAARLADSIWAGLWWPPARALRDKPPRRGEREIVRFPRAQLGRAAGLFLLLGQGSGQRRWEARADSCLSAFAPYVEDAGVAAAYYGVALIRKLAGANVPAAGT